jgi:hypothetical protein
MRYPELGEEIIVLTRQVLRNCREISSRRHARVIRTASFGSMRVVGDWHLTESP